jgi:hypothetical protein
MRLVFASLLLPHPVRNRTGLLSFYALRIE